MKVFELMSKLGKLKAGEEVIVSVNLKTSDLADSNRVGDDFYSLDLKISEVVPGNNTIWTYLE